MANGEELCDTVDHISTIMCEMSTNFLCPEIPPPTLVMYGSMLFMSTNFLIKMPSVHVACDAHPHALISSMYAQEG